MKTNKSNLKIIAEVGSNWNGSIRIGKKIIKQLKNVGTDAVKFQTYRAKTVYADKAGKSEYLSDQGNSKEINEILGVDAYIEGSIIKPPGNNKYYANITLIDAEKGNNLWAKEYSKTAEEILTIPNTIVSEVSKFLSGEKIAEISSNISTITYIRTISSSCCNGNCRINYSFSRTL